MTNEKLIKVAHKHVTVLGKACDRAARFLGGLDLRDHSKQNQQEALAIVRELSSVLGKKR